ncbi:MAG: hypothetical protein IJT24_01860 [Lachnospiraceae bacterium]|nr:hypothetical protein [Lachnospiraceae bacterium]
MKSMVRSLNMFMLDYLIVPVWAVFSVLGNRNSAKIMVPITIVFIALNYLNTRSATRLFLLDVNLAAASVAGIILNTFLYIRFIYADPLIITDMVGIIFLYTLFIITACIICLTLKAIMHRRNMRIISRMAYGAYDADDDEDYDEDEYEEDDEDEDDEEEEGEDGTGFLTSISNLLRSRKDEDEEEGEEEEEEPEEDEDDGYTKPDGPKFRVVKK